MNFLAGCSPSEAFEKEQEERRCETELHRAKKKLEDIQNQARHEAMDEVPPETVTAYQEVYARNPKGWPPVGGEDKI